MSPISPSSDNFRRQDHFCGVRRSVCTEADPSRFPPCPSLAVFHIGSASNSSPRKKTGAHERVSSLTTRLRSGRLIGMSSVFQIKWDLLQREIIRQSTDIFNSVSCAPFRSQLSRGN